MRTLCRFSELTMIPRRRLLLIALIIVLTTSVFYFFRRPIDDALFYFVYDGTRAERRLKTISQRVQREKPHDGKLVRGECFQIAGENPDSRAEVIAYTLIATQWPDSEDAVLALDMLCNAVGDISIDDLARSFAETSLTHGVQWRRLGAILFDRVRQEPDHPKSADLLCSSAIMSCPEDDAESATEELIQIANLIQQRYATSPDLSRFCEAVSNSGYPASWSVPFETHIRHILSVNRHRQVQCSAHFALATIVNACGDGRREDARQLYVSFLRQFDGETNYPAQGIERMNRHLANETLKILGSIGGKAPETRGVDLDGNQIALDDYLGRVVFVSFWASWCHPCLQAIPKERDLLATFRHSGFAIIGVNADDDVELAKSAVRRQEITWPSFRNEDQESRERAWTVMGYPSYYLLDERGVIRRYWSGTLPVGEVKTAIRELLGE